MDRKLAAILAADVAGFSRLVGADEEATLARFHVLVDIVTDVLRRHLGRIFSGSGVSVFAEFASPVEVILALLALGGVSCQFTVRDGEDQHEDVTKQSFPDLVRPTRHFRVESPAKLTAADALTIYDRIRRNM